MKWSLLHLFLISMMLDVFRPTEISNYNQIFSRDIGFVIDNKFVKSNILPDRAQELKCYRLCFG